MEPRPLERIETQALTLFANGKTIEEIGQYLKLRKAVVQDHLRVAVRKLGACNRVHAVSIAVDLKLVKVGK